MRDIGARVVTVVLLVGTMSGLVVRVPSDPPKDPTCRDCETRVVKCLGHVKWSTYLKYRSKGQLAYDNFRQSFINEWGSYDYKGPKWKGRKIIWEEKGSIIKDRKEKLMDGGRRGYWRPRTWWRIWDWEKWTEKEKKQYEQFRLLWLKWEKWRSKKTSAEWKFKRQLGWKKWRRDKKTKCYQGYIQCRREYCPKVWTNKCRQCDIDLVRCNSMRYLLQSPQSLCIRDHVMCMRRFCKPNPE